MSGLEIALLVVGLLFFVASFFFTEKLSSSDIETIEKMSEKEVNILIDKHLNKASGRINTSLDTILSDSLNKFDKEVNKKTTEEIYAISEHADSVKASLDGMVKNEQKAREEVMFLYDRLAEKQETLTGLERDVAQLESSLRNMKKSVEDAIERLQREQKIAVVMSDAPEGQGYSAPAAEPVSAPFIQQSPGTQSVVSPAASPAADPMAALEEDPEVAALLQSMAEVMDSANRTIAREEAAAEPAFVPVTPVPAETYEPVQEAYSYEDEIARELDSEVAAIGEKSSEGNINEKIVALHREGFSDVDIARQLDKGVGEIRLVLGLFDEV